MWVKTRFMIYRFNFGRHQMAICLNRRRGRPNKPLAIQAKEFISYLIKIGTNQRLGGHPLSRVLRRVFENKKIKKIFSFNLVIFTLVSGIATPSISALSQNSEMELVKSSQSSIPLKTESSIRKPLNSFIISQGYHPFHRAIDFKEKMGTPVYSIADGLIEQISYSRFSYGNHIIINHGSGFKSLYAHLGKIIVKQGKKVNKNTVIGTVGSTGFSTGPHLHLEVYDHGEPFNPLTILN